MKGDSRPAVIKVRPLSRPVKKCAHIHTHTHTRTHTHTHAHTHTCTHTHMHTHTPLFCWVQLGVRSAQRPTSLLSSFLSLVFLSHFCSVPVASDNKDEEV